MKSKKRDGDPQKKSSNPDKDRELKLSKQDRAQFQRTTQLSQMQKMDPIKFEWFVGWVYEQRGYTVKTTVASGDEGIDLELWRWGKKVVVQCKRYKGTVGQPTVRDLYGTMFHSGARAAHVVTTGKFSRQAEKWAAGKPIVLIDGHDLVALVNKMRRKQEKAKGAPVNTFNPTQLLIVLGFISFLLTTLWWWFS